MRTTIMKRSMLLLISLFAAGTVFGQKTTGITYFKGSFNDFRVAAKEKRLPELLYIHGDNDAEQILYDKRVMSDTAITRLIDTSMMAYQVNTTEDYNIALQYQIQDSPVLIIMDKNGWEIDRLYGYKKPQDIVKFLKQIYE